MTTTAADLTPYEWPAKELTEARVAFICALMANFPRMEQHLRNLPHEALVDLVYALDVMHPVVRTLVDPPVLVTAGATVPKVIVDGEQEVE